MVVIGPDRCYIVSFKLFLGNNFEITDLDELKYILEVLVLGIVQDVSFTLIKQFIFNAPSFILNWKIRLQYLYFLLLNMTLLYSSCP